MLLFTYTVSGTGVLIKSSDVIIPRKFMQENRENNITCSENSMGVTSRGFDTNTYRS